MIAGAAAGVLATRYATIQSPAPTTSIATLDDLQLSPEQRERIQKIWEGVKQTSDQSYQKATRIQQELEQKRLDLLTPEQKQKYAKDYEEYRNQYLTLQADRDVAVKKAIEATKSLLSDGQRQTYDAILKNRLGHPDEALPQGHLSDLPKTAATRPAGTEL
jgi:hypothetical protein